MEQNTKSGRRWKPARRGALAVVATLFATLLVGGVGAGKASAATWQVINDGGVGVRARSEPRIADNDGYGVASGATVSASCWTRGDAVGPNGNTIWWWITSPKAMYIADYYVSSPYVATSTPSEPRCGGGSTSNLATKVWLGSPVEGQWAPSGSFSNPATHWGIYYNQEQRDWSVDIGTYQRQVAVYLYAAPKYSSQVVTARVAQIGSTCRAGVSAGGSFVRVTFHDANGTEIGSATFGHIVPAPGIAVGQSIPRWGTRIGTVGAYASSACWDGIHVHVEMYSKSSEYACYNGALGQRYGAALQPTNYLGYTGTGLVSGPGRACPSGT